ncbi:paraquat-inducible protein B [Endozoicomonas sp. OPT23]|uniref:intermembrane transport protein PqiB n=1 Tax=Endozoicomonas sp. OPT23 TaxID=2072845 RepID=UPI00129AC6B9|nr:intermembrane transport protein PqiB [Endozoicomonas sp. OPT23]MRI34840.1 paraquat-inducible protein B [Endozoicomonas sp. OPT23]
MSETSTQATTVPQRKWSSIWLVPIVALIIGASMLFQHISNQGPEIILKLPTAEGIEEGKTPIKALNVTVGTITNITLSKNYDHIIAKARMNHDAARMLKEDTLFWVVKPRIGAEGISGLETLLSGAYLELQPGSSKAKRDRYTVLDQPPIAPPNTKGIRLVLTHREAEKLSVGDPVLYEGFTVGRVEQTSFDIEDRQAHYQLFIFAPYDRLVSSESYFWQSSGIDMKLDTEGIEVKVDSLESLLKGGVTFASLSDSRSKPEPAEQMQQFRLFDDANQVKEGMYDKYLEFVLLFDESIRGLKPKAPVEYRGIRIGTVMKVLLRNQSEVINLGSHSIPVLVRIELGRVYGAITTKELSGLKAAMDGEFKRGLKAKLKTGNLITGALYIDTDYYSDQDMSGPEKFDSYPVFPTQRGGFAEVQKQVTDLLQKLNQLPIEETLESINKTLATSQKTIKSFEDTANSLKTLLASQDTQALPADLHQTMQQLQQTLEGISPDSEMYRRLDSTLKEVKQVMSEFKPVLRQLNQKPDSLIFGNGNAQDPTPVKASPVGANSIKGVQ